MARVLDRRSSPPAPRETPRDLAPNHHRRSTTASAVDCALETPAAGFCAVCDSEIWTGVNRWERAGQGYYSCAAAASYQITGLKPRGGETRAAANWGALAGRYAPYRPFGFWLFFSLASVLLFAKHSGSKPDPEIQAKGGCSDHSLCPPPSLASYCVLCTAPSG
jgi:hypothetical protein